MDSKSSTEYGHPALTRLEHVRLLVESFYHCTGQSLVPDLPTAIQDWPLALYQAPIALISHQTGPDPLINYANQTTLTLWETTWDEFIGLPSRLTAEADAQVDRARLLAAVATQGYGSGYQGIRISRRGRRFRIEDAVLWNLVNPRGQVVGQAARIPRWTLWPDVFPNHSSTN